MDRILASSIVFTYAIIAVNVVVSLVGFAALKSEAHRSKFVFIPSEVAKGKKLLGLLLSHVSHGDFGHLALNMLSFYFFAPTIERQLGGIDLLTLYLISGVAASFAIFVFRWKNPRYQALGASGSVSGVIFGSVVIQPSASIYLFFIPIPVPAPVFAVVYLVMSSYLMGRQERGGIAHEAHIGGALAGLVLAGILSPQGFDPLIQRVSALLNL